jgi:ketosteroid isomerase-like protein
MKPLWVVAFVALGSCLIANAQTADTAQKLTALEQSFNEALLSADWKTVERIHANDLVFTNADGSVTHKADLVDSIRSGDMKFESIEMSDVKVQDLGKVAVVTGKLVERGRYKTDDLSGTYRFTDVWAKRDGNWQIVSGQETRVPANPSAGPLLGQQNVKTPAEQEKAEVVKLQDALIDAYVHHDLASLDRILADEYTFINDDAGGVVNKKQILDSFKSGGDREITSYTRQDDRVRIYGDVAVLTYRYHSTETYKGRENGGDFRVTRIFAKQNSRWRIVGGQETRVSQPEPSLASASREDVLTLKQLEQDWLDAYREGDADKMGKILADDFVGRWGDGSTQTKEEQLKAIRTGAEKHSANQLVECNVRIYGDTAVVTGINTEQSILEGRDGSGTVSFTDVFVKRHGHWQVVASETKSVRSSNPSARDRLIGTWKLVSTEAILTDGSSKPFPEYGLHPVGYLMYDATGHMCVTLANPNPPHWADPAKPTNIERALTHEAMEAYCGTYEVREKESQVIHRPELAEWPHYIGSDQVRNFRFEGNRLILSLEETVPNGGWRRSRITWERVEAYYQ